MYYDALLLVILGYNTWRGSAKGVTWQLAGIAAILLCFLFAAPLSLTVAPMIKLDPPLNRWIAMLAIYLAFSFGSFAAARGVRSMLESFKFQEYDRHLGALFGFVKGAVICLVLTFFVVALSQAAREKVLRTNSGRLAGYLLYKSSAVLPRELDGVLAPYFRKIEGELIEIADEEQRQTDPRQKSVLPFDLDPRQDEPARRPQAGDDRDDQGELDEFSGPKAGDRGQIADWGERAAEENPAEEPSLLDEAAQVIGDRLKTGVSDLVGEILSGKRRPDPEIRNSKRSVTEPEPTEQGDLALRARDTGDPRARRPVVTARDDAQVEQLVGEIALAFTVNRDVRAALQADVERILEGVPATIARQALADWRADLYGRPADPDPETDVETTLEQRIVRQLEKSRISMSDLPNAVRERLRRAR